MLFVDLEMACWEDRVPNTGEIIEIGICEVDVVKLEITRKAQYYVKPENDEVSEFCTKLTGITPRKILKQGRPLREVMRTIEKNYGGINKTFCAWGSDDKTLMDELAQKDIEFKMGRYIDLANLYRLLKGESKASTQLDAMKDYGLSFEGRQHSGVVDAENLARLYIEIMRGFRKD